MTRREEFIRDHEHDGDGGRDPCVLDEDEGVFVFADGATCSGDWGGFLREPPRDPHKLAKVVLRYWELRHAEAEAAYDSYRDQLKEVARANASRRLPPPSGKKLDHLRELRDAVVNCRARVQAARAKVDRTEPAEVKRLRLIREAEKAEREGPYFKGRPLKAASEWAEEHREWDREFNRIKP